MKKKPEQDLASESRHGGFRPPQSRSPPVYSGATRRRTPTPPPTFQGNCRQTITVRTNSKLTSQIPANLHQPQPVTECLFAASAVPITTRRTSCKTSARSLTSTNPLPPVLGRTESPENPWHDDGLRWLPRLLSCNDDDAAA